MSRRRTLSNKEIDELLRPSIEGNPEYFTLAFCGRAAKERDSFRQRPLHTLFGLVVISGDGGGATDENAAKPVTLV